MISIAFEERIGAADPVNGLNPGTWTAPTLADLDGDGDLDLVVGEVGGRVRYYLNTGTAWAPRFSQQNGNGNPFNGIDLVGDATTTPVLADMDADGDLDLVMGDAGGDLNYYENTGTAVAPTFARRSGTANPFSGLDVNGSAGLGYSAPAVADLDGDGDLDLAVGAKNGRIHYYENSGTAVTMAFSGNPAAGAVGAANPFAGITVRGTAAPAFWDLDGDGDLDLAVGDGSGYLGSIHYYENTGSATAAAFSVTPTNGFAFNDVNLGLFIKPAFADLDGDGAPDLVFGSLGNGLDYREGVRDVETSRTLSSLAYREEAVNPFRGIAVGGDSMPAFADLDADGDLDLVMGGGTAGLHYFENVGNALAPLFEERVGATDNPLDGVVIYGGKGAPTFADLDADGDLDLMIGNRSGTISYYRNIGNARSPRYQVQTDRAENPFGGLYVHGHAAPALADLDGDGDLDLLVGDEHGGFRYYENTGDAAAAVFERRHPGQGSPLEYDYSVPGRAAPTLGDLDGDGDLDLLVGRGDGFFNYYENVGNAAAPAFPFAPDSNTLRGIDAGDYAAPVFADLDGDALLELVSGHGAGGLAYYRPVVARTIHTRDAAGRVVRIDYDEDGDGAVDRAVLDPDGDGDLDRLESYLQDENAVRVGQVGFDLPLSYALAADNPFDGVAVDRDAAPALVDLDGDGDLDLVLGEWGIRAPLTYYRNNDGAFAEQTGADDPFDGIDTWPGEAKPRFVDLDADGDLDLVLGKGNGFFNYYENTGGAAAPAFRRRQNANEHPLHGEDVGENAAPAFADLDGDGDLDLLVGKESGQIDYYENIGNAGTPMFQRRSDANEHPLHGEDVGENAAPAFADLDGDGDLDLVVGKGNGFFNYYENTGGATAPAFQRRLNANEHPLHGVTAGENVAPTFADLDGDRFPELVVGNKEGVLKYYRVARSLETYTLNENGDVIRTDFDDDADGTADRVERYVLDSAGRVIETGIDKDADNTVDRREFDADADGALERTEYDTDDDGVVNRIEFDDDEDGVNNRVEYDEDDNGDVDKVEFDADDDGTVDRTESHTWSNAGFITGTLFDDDADGAFDRHYAYTRDSAGRATATAVDEDYDGVVDRTEYDTDADGDIDRVEFNTDDAGPAEHAESYARDDGGGIIRIDFDYGLDGVIDRTRLDTDKNGVFDRTEYDSDGDGVAERVEIDANENGAVERTEFDSDEDGVAERVVLDANENGAVDRIEFDNDGDGAPDRVVFYAEDSGTVERSERRTYDGDGRLDATQIDDGDNGVFDRSESYAYDGGGRLSETRFDDDHDGAFDRAERYAYDSAGRLDKTQFDDNYDGVFDRSESYAYGGGRLGKTRFDDNYDGVFDRSESYARNDAGAVMRVEIERDKDDFVDEYRYDHDADGTFDWISYDRNDDGMMDRFEFHWDQGAAGNPLPVMYALTLDEDAHRHTVSFHDGSGEVASGWGNSASGFILDNFSFVSGRDVVAELKAAPSVGTGAAFSIDAGLLAGVPAIQLAGAGAGSTDLSISGAALGMLAGGDENYQLHIDGDGDDVLRFDMDDFTEGENVNLDGDAYRQFVGEDGGFLVDPDVVLVDV